MEQIVHLVLARKAGTGSDWIVQYTAVCGIENVVEHWWTINTELVTCDKCKAARQTEHK